MDRANGRKSRIVCVLILCVTVMALTARDAAACAGCREDSCGPGEHRDRVSGPAIVGQLTLTDRGTTIDGLTYLDVEFISKSASCSGQKLIVKDPPIYYLKLFEIFQIEEECGDPLVPCLQSALFSFNGINPAPPSCAPEGWDQVVVSTVLTMDKSLDPPATLIADVVLLWFNPACPQ